MKVFPLDGEAAKLSVLVPRFQLVDGGVFRYKYGTAGFREHAQVLPSALLRVGMLAALESKFFQGRAVGVMVTASHNQGSDNGAKIMDWQGEMLAQSWEQFATELANAVEGEAVYKVINQFVIDNKIDIDTPATVFVACDTRVSSPFLVEMVTKGVRSLGGHVCDEGRLTTPQLHWIVRAFNQDPTEFSPPDETDRSRDLKQYNLNLQSALQRLLPSKVAPLTVDCANGIGAVALQNLQPYIESLLSITRMNDDIDNHEKLNNGVGAEHVQKNRSLPASVDPAKDQAKKFASMDGDADRVVYFFVNDDGTMNLLDGDKIIALVAGYLGELVAQAKLQLSIGVVQTAYANGAATNYISSVLNVPVACVPTGVKFLHHKAAEYDIGIYFEANGHGTVLFKPDATKAIQQTLANAAGAAKEAAEKLLALNQLINQAVGDAVSDILLVEVVLAARGITLQQWAAMYNDLPSHQAKVSVADRSVVVTTDAERRVQSPPALQAAIDAAVAQFSSARAFVRPSGTEDVVRTYAEAATEDEAKALGKLVGQAVFDHAGGVA